MVHLCKYSIWHVDGYGALSPPANLRAHRFAHVHNAWHLSDLGLAVAILGMIAWATLFSSRSLLTHRRGTFLMWLTLAQMLVLLEQLRQLELHLLEALLCQ